jgi:hypothetical protein
MGGTPLDFFYFKEKMKGLVRYGISRDPFASQPAESKEDK